VSRWGTLSDAYAYAMGFVAIMVALAAVLAVWLLYALIRAPRLHRPWSLVAASFLVLLVIASFGWYPLDRLVTNVDGWRWLSAPAAALLPVVVYTALGTALLGVINLVWSTAHALTRAPRLEPRELSRTGRLHFVRAVTAGIVVVAMAVTGYGYREAHHVQITHTTCTFSQLPAQFDGFRIALISDVHVGAGLGKDFVQGIVNQVNAERPDLIVLAGDLSDGSPAQLGNDLLPLTNLKAPFGVLATTGNHEFDTAAGPWVDWLNKHKLPVLDNSGTILIKGDASIDVLGINDRVGKPPYAPDLQLAANRLHDAFGVPVNGAGRFRILIAHEPLQVYGQNDLASKLGVNLQLSGHTHGGQIWPLQYLVTMQQPALDGVHVFDGVTVVTSRGAGSWGPPVRVGAPPEIPIITLRRG